MPCLFLGKNKEKKSKGLKEPKINIFSGYLN